MSAPEASDQRARLFTIQIWVGVGLAGFGALLLIFGATGAAAAFAILGVAVLGYTMIMERRTPSQRQEIEEALLDELDTLREDVRNDITTAARATHKALNDRVSHLQESLVAVQRQVEQTANEARAAEARALEAHIAEVRALEARMQAPALPSPRPAAIEGRAVVRE